MKTETLFAPVAYQSKKSPMFEKRTVMELSDNELISIDAGTGGVCVSIATAVASAIIAVGQGGYGFGQWIYGVMH